MPRRLWIASLSVWPGLSQIWSGQEVMGLVLAALFATSLNAAILTHLVWTEMVSPGMAGFFCSLAGLIWVGSTLSTFWWVWRCHPDRYREEIDRSFRDGQQLYLQGRWNEARRLYEQILMRDETDAEALLKLGTLYHRTAQIELARRAYRQCLELDGGSSWRWEIQEALGRLDPPQTDLDPGEAAEGSESSV